MASKRRRRGRLADPCPWLRSRFSGPEASTQTVNKGCKQLMFVELSRLWTVKYNDSVQGRTAPRWSRPVEGPVTVGHPRWRRERGGDWPSHPMSISTTQLRRLAQITAASTLPDLYTSRRTTRGCLLSLLHSAHLDNMPGDYILYIN